MQNKYILEACLPKVLYTNLLECAPLDTLFSLIHMHIYTYFSCKLHTSIQMCMDKQPFLLGKANFKILTSSCSRSFAEYNQQLVKEVLLDE